MWTNDSGCDTVKFYLQKQVADWSWPQGPSLSTLSLHPWDAGSPSRALTTEESFLYGKISWLRSYLRVASDISNTWLVAWGPDASHLVYLLFFCPSSSCRPAPWGRSFSDSLEFHFCLDCMPTLLSTVLLCSPQYKNHPHGTSSRSI